MRTKLCVVALVALIAWSLKRYYADAGADDLWWILAPSARVTGVITGISFADVPSEGYVSYERRFVIEKSCAGINFLIAAFGMLVFALIHRVRSSMSALVVLGASLIVGSGAAVLVNSLRITLALWLAEHPATLFALTPADVHRLEGITVYFAGLVLLCELVRGMDRRLLPLGSRS